MSWLKIKLFKKFEKFNAILKNHNTHLNIISIMVWQVLVCGSNDCAVLSCWVMSASVTPWTVDYQAPLFMEFPRQEYWNGLLFPTPGDLPDPGIETASLVSPALVGRFFTTVPPGKAVVEMITSHQFFSLFPIWTQTTWSYPLKLRCVLVAWE